MPGDDLLQTEHTQGVQRPLFAHESISSVTASRPEPLSAHCRRYDNGPVHSNRAATLVGYEWLS